ncbi:MAG: hypothetical protein WEB88_00560 [Gemmatimonadota bacterium]
MRARAPLLLVLAALAAAPAAAQRSATALDPDSVTVGEVARVAVVVSRPSGVEAAFPDSLMLPPDVEMAGPRTLVLDTTGERLATAIYPVTAWRPGVLPLGSVTVAFSQPTGASLEVTLPTLVVLSVLPPDTAGIEARPPKDVLGANRVWWPILLALLVLALLAALAWWLWRRRTVPEEIAAAPHVPGMGPRAEALAALELAAQMPLEHRDQVKFFHARMTATLRRYAVAVDRRLGPELTTTELAARVGGAPALEPLLALLRRADLVKFARRSTTAAEARAELERARAWVAAWPPPVVRSAEEERAA